MKQALKWLRCTLGKRLRSLPIRSRHCTTSPWIAGLAAAATGAGLLLLGAWEPSERIAYTGLFLLRDALQPIEWDERIVVIAIDEPSLDAYGAFPWTRERYAALLDTLMPVQPAAIGFDILMSESTPTDAALAEAIYYSGNVVLSAGTDPLGNSIQVAPTVVDQTDGFVRVGHVNHTPDTDGISRQAFLYEVYGADVAPSLAISLLDTYELSLSGLLTPEPIEMPDLNAQFMQQPQRYSQNNPLWLNWPGHTRLDHTASVPQGVTTLSFSDVIAEDADPQLLAQLQNKIVLVGYTAVGIVGNSEDALRTPFEQQIPTAGVYLHAAILDNLLNDRFLMRLSPKATLLLVITIGFVSSLLFSPRSANQRLMMIVGIILLWCAIAYGSFLSGLWIPIAAPIGTSLLGLIGIQFIEQRERKTLMDLFAINLSPEMADFIWEHKGELLSEGQIQPQSLNATLLFSDIRGFTSISEKLPSDVLLPWLNRYFEAMTDCIMAHGGVVDKYIGDAIMAAFGAPIAQPTPEGIRHQAIAAVNASLAMVGRLEELNSEFAAEGLPTVQFGVGLHTGAIMAGTVGSRHRASYSLFGDTVNVAARLQNLTKTLQSETPYPILLSGATAHHVEEHFRLTQQGQLQLQGRSQTTKLYTIARDDNEAKRLEQPMADRLYSYGNAATD
ncbi:CHASE2 domain-containing protein [Oscillatoria sp. CS-180]|uniref:CHASE2 domain-containing protein n=1 Tax=Oscillatoria sp. CS-180 TaxID=3021720 RepID=UPI002330E95C|nr:adenylate/guanylate cyclase domain-containing protein [Oscillatoria sp. CS-180]